MFSDAAIQFCLTIKGEGRPENSPVDCFQFCTGEAPGEFKLPPGQTTGMVASLLQMANLGWAVPDFTPYAGGRKHWRSRSRIGAPMAR